MYDNDVWCCQNCRRSVKTEDVDNLVSALQQMLQEIIPNLENVESFETFLTTTENLLHENHFLRVIARRFLSQLYVAASHATQKRDFCKRVLELFDKLDPGLSQTRGLTLVKITYFLKLLKLNIELRPKRQIFFKRFVKH